MQDDFTKLDLEEIASILYKYKPLLANLLPQLRELYVLSNRGSLLEAPLGLGVAKVISTLKKDSKNSPTSSKKLYTSACFELITLLPSLLAALLVATIFGSIVYLLLLLSYKNY